MPKALFVGIEAKAGATDEIAAFLKDALAVAENEPHTRDWYAVRFDAQHFGIFDTFADNAGRMKHLIGRIGRSLAVKSFTSLKGLPDFETSEIVAAKLPQAGCLPRTAAYVSIETKLGQGRDFGEFLVAARAMVDDEPGTLAWYALRLGPNHFAIVDFFTDETARTAHANGPVAAQMKALAEPMIERSIEIRNADVLASKQSGLDAMVLAEQKVHSEQTLRVRPETA